MTRNSLSRRTVLGCGALAGVGQMFLGGAATGAARGRIVAEEHWVTKGDVRLYVYRKRMVDDAAATPKPVVFLVHGSSFSGRGGYDLQVPGHPGYSMMDDFAHRGFDVWTMDHEGYGRSTRTGSYSDINSGADDLAAAFALLEQVTKVRAPMVYSQSGGALRAGVFAMREPDRIGRLIFDGFSYTGDGAPEIMRRRERIDEYRKSSYRTSSVDTFRGIFSRDDPSTFEPAVAEALAAYELKLGNRIPNGTYLDMATKLPMVDPKKLPMPVQLIRAATDGNATDEELLTFFGMLPNKDKQMIFVSGIAHVAVLCTNRQRVFHAIDEFLRYPVGRNAESGTVS
jgi:pimeloyl-ACP methyl ester carboxylesterase